MVRCRYVEVMERNDGSCCVYEVTSTGLMQRLAVPLFQCLMSFPIHTSQRHGTCVQPLCSASDSHLLVCTLVQVSRYGEYDGRVLESRGYVNSLPITESDPGLPVDESSTPTPPSTPHTP